MAGNEAVRILVVDDDARIRTVVRRGLAYEGYHVTEAASGEEALRLAREQLPQLVVLDVMLPGIDGLEVTRRLRASGDHVAVLMLTARDEVKDRVQGLETGADDYLVKPFSFEELLARVHALLRRRAPEGEILRIRGSVPGCRCACRRPRWPLIRADHDGVQPAAVVHAPSTQGPDAGRDHGARLGLRLRG